MGIRSMGLVLVVIALGIAAPAWADPAIRLPEGEEPAAWVGALRLAGLLSGGDDAPLRVEVVGDTWRIVAVGRDGRERRVVVDEPTDEADRESVAFLARGLLREILQRPRSLTAPIEPKVPADTAPGEAESRPAPPTKGTTGGPQPGSPARIIEADALERAGTSDAAPVGLPADAEVEIPVVDRGARTPPLWLRMGGTSRSGLEGAQLLVGAELHRRGRVRLNLEVGGVIGRERGPGVAWQLGRFDLEGSATVAVLGPASIGGGFGGSYRTYRRGDVLDRQVVPTAQLRVDVPLYTGRRVTLIAHLQGKLDLARTDLALPDGGTWRRAGFEIQPALILRYHGALDLLSGYRSRGEAKRRATP